MKSKLIAILVTTFSFFAVHAQTKFPLYSFGSNSQICHTTSSTIEDNIIQIFSDPTFSVINYKSTLPFVQASK